MNKLKKVLLIAGIAVFALGAAGLGIGFARESRQQDANLKTQELIDNADDDHDKFNAVQIALAFASGNEESRAEGARMEAEYAQKWQDFGALLEYYSQSEERQSELKQIVETLKADRNELHNDLKESADNVRNTKVTGILLMCVGAPVAVAGAVVKPKKGKAQA